MRFRYQIILIFIAILILAALFGCGSKSLLSVNPELTLTKAKEDVVVGLKTQVEDLTAQVGKLLELNANLEAKVEANAQAGVGNRQEKNEIQAQGDVVQVQNDSTLMKYVVYTLGSLCMSLIFGLVAIAKKLLNVMREKKSYKDRFLTKCVHSEEELQKFRAEHEAEKQHK